MLMYTWKYPAHPSGPFARRRALQKHKGGVIVQKLTMQDLADMAGVSRITVWKVLNNRPGVSSAVRDRVCKAAIECGIPLRDAPAPEGESKKRVFAVAVARPESSTFWMQIIHHLAQELSRFGAGLMYIYMPAAYQSGFVLPSSLSPAEIQAFVALNVYDATLLRMLSGCKMPKVFLDTVPALPVSALQGDLVLLEGRTRTREITKSLLASGRARLGFIGDVNYSQTNCDRYKGFLDAYKEAGLMSDPALSLTEHLDLHSHYEQIRRFLDALPALPDGFVCASDFIASFVRRYFEETGRKVDARFLITGFDDSREYPNVSGQITTVNVATEELGKMLARKLMYRADYPDAPFEVSYVSTQILYRGPLKKAQ